jgi:hypothetical protein
MNQTNNPSRNDVLFERAKKLIPGGVNSPVRAFKAVGGTPRFVQRAQGAYFWDADGKRYIDYIGSWGPMILGHGHPAVLDAVQKAMLDGFSFGAPTEREVELAEGEGSPEAVFLGDGAFINDRLEHGTGGVDGGGPAGGARADDDELFDVFRI